VTELVDVRMFAEQKHPRLDLCVRSFEFEDRASGGDGRTLEGYAAVFNTPTRIRDLQGDFDEVILPGAFARSLGERTPVLQWDHGKDPRIGTVPIGAIEQLSEDGNGLHVRARLFDHPDVERVRQAIVGKAVKGMSFRFGVPEQGDTWSRQGDGSQLREIRDADVHELGPVVFPAYDTTSVSVRSLLAHLDAGERQALVRELAAEVRLALDLSELAGDGEIEDLTGGSDAWRADRGEPTDARPGNGTAPPVTHRQRLDDGALRVRGILT
jgi:HK97 family phage prohead protease